MVFSKEDSTTTNYEFNRVMQEITNLSPTLIQSSFNQIVTVNHIFHLTMVDGKVINVLIGNKATSVSKDYKTPIFHNIPFFFSRDVQFA